MTPHILRLYLLCTSTSYPHKKKNDVPLHTLNTVFRHSVKCILMRNPGSLSSIWISFYGHVWSLMKTNYSDPVTQHLSLAKKGNAPIYLSVFFFVSFYDHKKSLSVFFFVSFYDHNKTAQKETHLSAECYCRPLETLWLHMLLSERQKSCSFL